ncbi:transglycosylase domain-containing protein, partial [bacterium]|nr:transglycosylase domain-containing protein [candidate division CSSED10-310 bacterium]
MKAIRWAVMVLLALLAGGSGGAFLAGYLHFSAQLPELNAALNYRPSLITHIYDRHGCVLAELAVERRFPVPLAEIAPCMHKAIIAIEDENFYSHRGLDLEGILRAAWINFLAGDVVQGGSTITQQLAKSLFLTHERTMNRKIKEAILAYRLEEELTKSRILELYLNQVYFGSGAYGVEAAAQRYFSTSARNLELHQAALLAGLPKAPSRFSPLVNPDLALHRRNQVLQRMAEAGFISGEEAGQCIAKDLQLHAKPAPGVKAPYFIEILRRQLEREFGADTLYRAGWDIYTTLDLAYQEAAETAVRNGLLDIEKRRRQWRGPVQLPASDRVPEPGEPAVWTVAATGDSWLTLVCSEVDVRLNFRDIWIKNKDLILLNPGDRVWFVVDEYTDEERTAVRAGRIIQEPVAEAALVSMEVATGEVVAWVGGYSFWRSQFDRVTQAVRQPGSAFKPFIYAQALDTRYTAADVIYDTPIVVEKTWKTPAEMAAEQERRKAIAEGRVDLDAVDTLEDIEFWKPHNYSEEFFGATTLREGLAKSRNIMSIHLMRELGPSTVIQMARRLGITSPLTETLALALGSSGVTLMELTEAYGALANLGIRAEPMMIQRIIDRDQHIVKEYYPALRPSIRPETAFLTTHLLQAVITEGTGFSAHHLGVPLAGKTGTTNNYFDAWFMGYSPRIVSGVWVGMDELEPIFKQATGAAAALPIWQAYMAHVIQDDGPIPFPEPEGIVFATICRNSGLLATPACQAQVREAFRIGTIPLDYCDRCGKTAGVGAKSTFTNLDWDAVPQNRESPTPVPDAPAP